MDGVYAYQSQDLMDLSLEIPDSILLILAGSKLFQFENDSLASKIYKLLASI